MEKYALLVGIASGVFLLSGLFKLAQPAVFHRFIHEIVGRPTLRYAVARVLPPLELVTGALLLTPLVPLGALLGIVLSALFVAGAALALRGKAAGGCGCFGTLDESTPHLLTLTRASLVLALAILILLVSLDGHRGAPTDRMLGLSIGLLVGVAAGLATTLIGQMVAYWNPFKEMIHSSST